MTAHLMQSVQLSLITVSHFIYAFPFSLFILNTSGGEVDIAQSCHKNREKTDKRKKEVMMSWTVISAPSQSAI